MGWSLGTTGQIFQEKISIGSGMQQRRRPRFPKWPASRISSRRSAKRGKSGSLSTYTAIARSTFVIDVDSIVSFTGTLVPRILKSQGYFPLSVANFTLGFNFWIAPLPLRKRKGGRLESIFPTSIVWCTSTLSNLPFTPTSKMGRRSSSPQKNIGTWEAF